jgi:hypothetical protein
MTAPNLTALDALIAAVEAGKFKRKNGPRRYNDFALRVENAGLPLHTAGLMDAFHKGDTECAVFLKHYRLSYRAQVAG